MPPPIPGAADPAISTASVAGRPRPIDKPEAGCFTIRLVRKGPRVPARIRFEKGEYWAEVNGARVGAAAADPLQADGVMRIWHYGAEIEQAEYDRLLRRPNPPNPRKPVRLNALPSIF